MEIRRLREIELPENTRGAYGTYVMEGDKIEFELSGKEPEKVAALVVRTGGEETDEKWALCIFVDCLMEESALGLDKNGRYPGWEGSKIRALLHEKYLDLFPDEIREKMIPFENGDLLRIPTEKEIFGENEFGEEEPNTEQFPLMKDRRNRIAFQGYQSGVFEWYWLKNRLRGVGSATSAACVAGCGSADWWIASAVLGVRPLFKIRNL